MANTCILDTGTWTETTENINTKTHNFEGQTSLLALAFNKYKMWKPIRHSEIEAQLIEFNMLIVCLPEGLRTTTASQAAAIPKLLIDRAVWLRITQHRLTPFTRVHPSPRCLCYLHIYFLYKAP